MKDVSKQLTNEITRSKMKYNEKLQDCFRLNNSKEAWQCLYTCLDLNNSINKHRFLYQTTLRQPTANELNNFYSRFDTMDFSDHVATKCSELRNLNIENVAKLFRKVKSNKSMGPDHADGINGKLLQCCARELAFPYTVNCSKCLYMNAHLLPVGNRPLWSPYRKQIAHHN